MRISVIAVSLAALSLGFGGCCMSEHGGGMAGMHGASSLKSVNQAVAVIYPTQGNSITGDIYFEQTADGVHIWGTVSGLAANSEHAIHIHEFGDQTSPDGSSAGGHYNPEGHKHGAPGSADHHAGDLGNITANAEGVATVNLTVKDISIGGQRGKDPIIGRGVVIHAKADDFSQPFGNAGGRIGVGVIGVEKVAKPAATMPAMPGM